MDKISLNQAYFIFDPLEDQLQFSSSKSYKELRLFWNRKVHIRHDVLCLGTSKLEASWTIKAFTLMAFV